MRDARSFRPRPELLEARDVPTAAGIYALGGGPGGPPRVQVFDSASHALLADFLAYEPTFTGGVSAAVGDVNNDGVPDLIVGAGVGGGPRVRVFDGRAFRGGRGVVPAAPTDGVSFADADVIADFFAFESSQRGGTFVTAGNFIGQSFADLAVGAGPGGGPRVRVLDGQQIAAQGLQYTSNAAGDTVANFFAFESSFRNGVVVSASPPLFGGSYSQLVVAPGPGGGPRVRVLDGNQIAAQGLGYTSFGTADAFADFLAADQASRTGLYVTTADFNNDGIPDVAVGTGAGLDGLVTIYNGSAIQSRRANFTGLAAGDVLTSFPVNPAVETGSGPATYSNGVTVGAMITAGGINQGALIYGWGGQGRFGRAQVLQFQTGSGGLLSPQTLATHLFDPTFVGGVFVSN